MNKVVHKDTNVVTNASIQVDKNDEGFKEVRNRKKNGENVASSSQSKPIGGVKLSKPKPNFWRPKVTTATNQGDTNTYSDSKDPMQAPTSNVKSGMNAKSSLILLVSWSIGR